ncbi:MAG: hypothetical protein GX605_07325, partial [Chloroflexi bacterium]|nr:hypothetical protein [Chloroflexota bacterium]
MHAGVEGSADELRAALAASQAIERMLQADGQGQATAALADLRLAVDGLLTLRAGYSPPPPALVERVRSRQAAPQAPPRHRLWQAAWRPVAALALTSVLTTAIFLTGPGEQALAALRAIFRVGTVQVQVAPEAAISPTPGQRAYPSTAATEPLADLAAAQALVSFPLWQVGYLPAG